MASKTVTCEPGDQDFTAFAYMRPILEKKAGCPFSKYEVQNYSNEPGEDYCVDYCVKIKVVFDLKSVIMAAPTTNSTQTNVTAPVAPVTP
jgi:hypothetical protein